MCSKALYLVDKSMITPDLSEQVHVGFLDHSRQRIIFIVRRTILHGRTNVTYVTNPEKGAEVFLPLPRHSLKRRLRVPFFLGVCLACGVVAPVGLVLTLRCWVFTQSMAKASGVWIAATARAPLRTPGAGSSFNPWRHHGFHCRRCAPDARTITPAAPSTHTPDARTSLQTLRL